MRRSSAQTNLTCRRIRNRGHILPASAAGCALRIAGLLLGLLAAVPGGAFAYSLTETAISDTSIIIGNQVTFTMTLNTGIDTDAQKVDARLIVKEGEAEGQSLTSLNGSYTRNATTLTITRILSAQDGIETQDLRVQSLFIDINDDDDYEDENETITISEDRFKYDDEWVTVTCDLVAPLLRATDPFDDLAQDAYGIGAPSGPGPKLEATLHFSEAVTSSGGLTLTVEGTASHDLPEVSWTVASDEVTFSEDLPEGSLNTDGTHPLKATQVAGAIRDVAGNTTTFASGWPPDHTWSGVTVDTVRPEALAFDDLAEDEYAIGSTLEATLNFSEAVTSSGGLTLTVEAKEVLSIAKSGWSTPAGEATFSKVLVEGSLNTDGTHPLKATQVAGTIADGGGNTTTFASGWPTPDHTWSGVTVDTVRPTSLNFSCDGQTLSAEPAHPNVTCAVSAHDNCALTFSTAVQGKDYSGGSVSLPIWDLASNADAGGSYTAAVTATDCVGNTATQNFHFDVDNPRVTSYDPTGIHVDFDPDGETTHLIPAGYSYQATVTMTNSGAKSIPGTRAKLTLKNVTGEPSCTITGFDLPANGSDAQTGACSVPTTTPAGSATLRVEHDHPTADYKWDTPPYKEYSGYSIVTSNVTLTTDIPTTVVAAQDFAISAWAKQADNGGVATDPSARGQFGALVELEAPGSEPLGSHTGVLVPNQEEPLAPSGSLRTRLDTPNGSVLEFTRSMFEVRTDQINGYEGDDDARVNVDLTVGSTNPASVQVLVQNCELEIPAITVGREPAQQEDDQSEYTAEYEEEVHLYLGLRNLNPIVEPNVEIRMDFPEILIGMRLADNPGWILVGTTGGRTTWRYPMLIDGGGWNSVPLQFDAPSLLPVPRTDTIHFLIQSDQVRVDPSDSIDVTYFNPEFTHEMCREYPNGEAVDAGDFLRYALTMGYVGNKPAVNAKLYLDAAETRATGRLRLKNDLGNQERLGLYFGGSWMPFAADSVQIPVDGRWYYRTRDPVQLVKDQEVTATLRLYTPTSIPDGFSVGLAEAMLRIRDEDDPAVFEPFGRASGCTRNPLATARNVHLVASVTIDPPYVLEAGSQRTLHMKVMNAGSKDLQSNWSFSPQATFIDNIVSVGDAPVFTGTGLDSGASSEVKDWPIRLEHDIARQSNIDLRSLFNSDFESWKFCYEPIHPLPGCGFNTDPVSGDFPWTQTQVDITAPALVGRIWTQPSGCVPDLNPLTVWVEVKNQAPGDQTGTYRIAFPTSGSLVDANLRRLDGGTEWPADTVGTVQAGQTDLLSYKFRVQKGGGTPDSVRLEGKIDLESDFPWQGFTDQVTNLCIVGTAVEVVRAGTQAEDTAGDTLSVRYLLKNNEAQSITAQFTALAPLLDPLGEDGSVTLVSAQFFQQSGGQDYVLATDPKYGEPLEFPGGSSIPGEGTSKLVLVLQLPNALRDSTSVKPGDLTISWRQGEPDAGSITHVFSTSCTVRNVHFEVVSATVAENPNLEAGKNTRLEVTVRNISPVLAGNVSARVKATHGSVVDSTLNATASGPIEADEGERTFLFDLFLDPQTYRNGLALVFDSLDLDAGVQGADPPTDGVVAWQAPVKNIDLHFEVKRLDAVLGDEHPTPGQPVDAGVRVPFGVFVENRGALSHSGLLRLRMELPGLSAIDTSGAGVHPQGVWQTGSVSGGIALILEDSPTLDPGEQLTYSDHVPAFSVLADGSLGTIQIVNRTIRGTVTVGSNTYPWEAAMPSGEDPLPVPVNTCGTESLVFELNRAGSSSPFFQGDSIEVTLETRFEASVNAIPGTLTLEMTLPDDNGDNVPDVPLRIVGVEPVALLAGSPQSGIVDWTEQGVTLVSELLRNRPASGSWEERWRIRLQVERVGPEDRLLAGADIFDFAVTNWVVDAGTEDIPCGLDPAGSIDWEPLTSPMSLNLQGSEGELVTFFARPNPAGRGKPMGICYDLRKGTTSVRLIVTDLAGNVVMTAAGPGEMSIDPGLNCLVWDVESDGVPNGVYLARLEVDGVSDNSQSLRATRRAKLAVLR